MSKLKELMESMAKGKEVNYNITIDEKPAVPTPSDETTPTLKYTRTWASKVALARGYSINSNDKKVDGILMALNRNNGHCPCGGNGDQFLCPCVNMRTLGICKCGLYDTIPERNISSEVSAKIN